MKQKDLDKEGITKEVLAGFDVDNLGNPVMLQPGDDPVNLLKTSKGFWVSVDGEVLKNKDGSYFLVSYKEAIVARARYMLLFSEEIEQKEDLRREEIKKRELEREVEKEVRALIDALKPKVKQYLDNIKHVLQYAGLVEPDLFFNLTKMVDNQNGVAEAMEAEAKEIVAQPDYFYSYTVINKAYEVENWDFLYVQFEQNGLALIGSFKTGDARDIEVLKNCVKGWVLEDIIKGNGEKSHLEMVARVKVGKLVSW